MFSVYERVPQYPHTRALLCFALPQYESTTATSSRSARARKDSTSAFAVLTHCRFVLPLPRKPLGSPLGGPHDLNLNRPLQTSATDFDPRVMFLAFHTLGNGPEAYQTILNAMLGGLRLSHIRILFGLGNYSCGDV